ncbi:MAG: hypothetical protein AAGC54_14465 [Cyanobacteria bacterium P01_F01_bin.4]
MAKKLSDVKTDQATKTTKTKRSTGRKTTSKRTNPLSKPEGTDAIIDAIERHQPGANTAPSVSVGALQGIEATQRQLAVDTAAAVPDVQQFAPSDYTQPSSPLRRVPELQREQELLEIKEQGYGADIMIANIDLAAKIEQAKAKTAQLLQAKAKTQTAVEGVTTELTANQLQQERSNTKRAELANAILEREGVEGLAAFIRQKREARYAKELATVKRMEAAAAKTMAAVVVEHVELPGGED